MSSDNTVGTAAPQWAYAHRSPTYAPRRRGVVHRLEPNPSVHCVDQVVEPGIAQGPLAAGDAADDGGAGAQAGDLLLGALVQRDGHEHAGAVGFVVVGRFGHALD